MAAISFTQHDVTEFYAEAMSSENIAWLSFKTKCGNAYDSIGNSPVVMTFIMPSIDAARAYADAINSARKSLEVKIEQEAA